MATGVVVLKCNTRLGGSDEKERRRVLHCSDASHGKMNYASGFDQSQKTRELETSNFISKNQTTAEMPRKVWGE